MKQKLINIILAVCLFSTLASGNDDGRMKYSLVQWSFRYPLKELCKEIKPLGITSFEIVGIEKWEMLKHYGYEVLIADGADLGIERGFVNPDFHEELRQRYSELIPKAAEAGIKMIICYSGITNKYTPEEAMENCVLGLNPVVAMAEKYGITLVMELFSSKEGKDKFFKHSFPFYVADNVEWGARLCDRLNSTSFRLLYDIWQMNDMGHDVVQNIKKYHTYIAHYQIAGIPSRKGISKTDDFDYNRVMKTIYETGYSGYIGLECFVEHTAVEVIKEAMEVLDLDETRNR
ncbi:MAG: sugar phosphate isomerase/epimerase family protein [Prolixibacteraceae bacterium]|jgi:hydroxypyruvate isomerase